MTNHPHTSPLGATVAFVVTSLIASILLISAFVLFLGELVGSHLLAMVIVGGSCALAAWVIYTKSLKPVICKLQEQIDTIYMVADSIRKAYDWVVEYVISRVVKEVFKN